MDSKTSFILFGMQIVHSYVLIDKETHVPRPSITKLTAMDGPSFEVMWTPVKSSCKSDPTIGYKVKVWALPEIKTKFETFKLPPMTLEPLEIGGTEIIVHGGTKNTLLISENLYHDMTYEIRVAAFTKYQTSAYSTPNRVKIYKPATTTTVKDDIEQKQ